MKTVVGLYDHINDAYRAVDALKDAGYRGEEISLISRDEANEYSRYIDRDDRSRTETDKDVSDGAAAGAGIGAVLGGLSGFLIGLGALAIPGIGPIVAAGPIVSALAGAGIGAVAGGLIGALVDLGIPEEEANIYAEAVRRGGTLVLVQTSDEMADRAADILNRFDPVDTESRATDYRQDNWSRFDERESDWDAERINRERGRYRRSDIPITGDMTRDTHQTGFGDERTHQQGQHMGEQRPRRVRTYDYRDRR
jgi:uncharacterized membrane protein